MIKLLQDYIDLISYKPLREDTMRLLYLPEVQNAFKYPSSISGKFHPQDESGEYGLLLHTLRVCNTAIQLYRCVEDYSNNPLAYDILIAGALLHDVPFKNVDGRSNYNHAHDNAKWYNQNSTVDEDIKQEVAKVIMWHMGRFSLQSHSDYKEFPNNLLAWTLHQGDCICSRSNILVNVDSVDYLRSNLQ